VAGQLALHRGSSLLIIQPQPIMARYMAPPALQGELLRSQSFVAAAQREHEVRIMFLYKPPMLSVRERWLSNRRLALDCGSLLVPCR
jgi:hypothetical protein